MKKGFRKRLLAGVLAAAVCRMLFPCVMCGNGTMAAAETVSSRVASDPEKAAYDYLVLVNKAHKLPDNWESNVVLKEGVNKWGETYLVEEKALEQFLKLQKECADEGIIIELDSTTRSVARQQELWDEWTIEKGENYVKKYVAVPGYSEHHTGLAIDVCLEKDGRRIDDNDGMIAAMSRGISVISTIRRSQRRSWIRVSPWRNISERQIERRDGLLRSG